MKKIVCFAFILSIVFFTAKPVNLGKARNMPQKTIYLVETSWYGKKFHGKKTANGKKFNMYDYTAAHRTLPFGTILYLVNPQNLLSTAVIINDRGPWNPRFLREKIKKIRVHPRRELDISYQAAKDLGMIKDGVIKLLIEIVEP